MSLNDEDRKSVVYFRLEKANRAYHQAKVNLDMDFL